MWGLQQFAEVYWKGSHLLAPERNQQVQTLWSQCNHFCMNSAWKPHMGKADTSTFYCMIWSDYESSCLITFLALLHLYNATNISCCSSSWQLTCSSVIIRCLFLLTYFCADFAHFHPIFICPSLISHFNFLLMSKEVISAQALAQLFHNLRSSWTFSMLTEQWRFKDVHPFFQTALDFMPVFLKIEQVNKANIKCNTGILLS